MTDDPQPVENPGESRISPGPDGAADPATGMAAAQPDAAPGPGAGPDSGPGSGSGSEDPAKSAKAGIELAREALAQAKADALKRGTLPGQGGRRRAGPRQARTGQPGRGGAPKPFGSAIRELLADRGWEQQAAVGGVFGNWPGIVGAELAEHTRPERFEDGELTVVADSGAWATQLRLLAATLVRRLNEELGDGTVRRVKVVGPSSGRRRSGGWRVK